MLLMQCVCRSYESCTCTHPCFTSGIWIFWWCKHFPHV